MIDLGLVVGHSLDAPGATNVRGETERQWCEVLARSIQQEALRRGLTAAIHLRSDTIRGYEAKMRELCARIAATPHRVVVSCHFNAAKDDHGVRVIHWPSAPASTVQFARRLCSKVAEAIGARRARTITNAGRDGRSHSWATYEIDDRGIYYPTGPVLHILDPDLVPWPVVILESYFGTHAEDTARATAARDDGRIATAVVDAAVDFGVELA